MNFKVGDIVTIKRRYSDHNFDIGQKVIITKVMRSQKPLHSSNILWMENDSVEDDYGFQHYEFEGEPYFYSEDGNNDSWFFWLQDFFSLKEILEKL